GQGRAPHRLAKAHVVQLRGLHRQTGLDVAQALPPSKWAEGHTPELLGATERPHPSVAAVALDDTGEGAPRQKIHQLGEKRLAAVHGHLLGSSPKSARSRSNRHHAFLPKTLSNPID